jgi:hypothetical protein
MKKYRPSDKQLKIRLSTEELERFKTLAKNRGLTLTEVVLLRMRNKLLPDRIWEREMRSVMGEFVTAVNRIDNNINQTKINLLILNRKREAPNPAREEFHQLYKTYRESIERIGRKLYEIQRS